MMQNQFLVGIYEKGMPRSCSIEEKLYLAKELGYDFIEMCVDEYDYRVKRLNMSKQEKISIIEAAMSSNISIGSLSLSINRKYPIGHPDQNISERGMQFIYQGIDLCVDLGIRTVLFAGYDVYYIESTVDTRKKFEDNLKQVVNYAAKKAVTIAIETMDTTFIDTCEKAMRYCDLLASPFLGIYLDVGNLSNASKKHDFDVKEDILNAKSKIMAVHFKDALLDQVRNVPYGEGFVDYQKFLNLLYSINVGRFVTEFWYEDKIDWREEVMKSKIFFDKVMNQYYRL
jgi:L-ribulose-5-phosphate 3-epimerase